MDGRFTGYTDQSRQRQLAERSQPVAGHLQRAHLYSLLKGYARDFRQMSEDNGAKGAEGRGQRAPMPCSGGPLW